jgi:PAS domain S-box-containing protein
MWVVDRETLRFRDVNEAAVREYGYSRDEFLAMSIKDIRPCEDTHRLMEHFAGKSTASEVCASLRAAGSWRHKRKDGALIDVEIAAADIEYEGRPSFLAVSQDVTERNGTSIGIGQDVTERKRAEEERSRLLRSEREARAQAEAALDRLHRIQDVTDAALARLGLDDLLRETLTRLRAAFAADVADVLLLAEEGPWLTVRASVGLAGPRAARDRVLVGEGVAGSVAQAKAPLAVGDVRSRAGIRESLRGHVTSMIAAPLIVEDQLVGVIDVASRARRTFREDDLRFLQMVADRVAPAIDRARLVEKLDEGREQLSIVSQQLVGAQETERREIARELHDEVGQLLTGLNLLVQSSNADRRTEMQAVVTDLMTRVRGLSMGLRPPMLDDLGVVPAVRWLFKHYSSQTGIRVDFRQDGLGARLPPATETAAFRIVQEALTNVARHAGVGAVTVSMTAGADDLRIEIVDLGRGYAADDVSGPVSAGLAGMRERARLVGGRLTVESQPGRGTRVSAVLPLGAAPARD